MLNLPAGERFALPSASRYWPAGVLVCWVRYVSFWPIWCLMPVLTAVTVLFFMQIVGEVIARISGLPLPGALIGMVLLLATLIVYGRVPSGLRDTCHHALKHLMLLFIPLVAGIMMYFDQLAHEWIPFLIACAGGVALTIVVTAVTFRWMLNRSRAH